MNSLFAVRITRVALVAIALALGAGIGFMLQPPSPAQAQVQGFQGSCYNPVEAEAEQLLRLHSKLMVAAITCRKSATGEDLAAAYTTFTRANLNRIRTAEQSLIAFYRKSNAKNPVAQLDRLRTLLANEYGQRIAQKSAPVFCGEERNSVVPMAQASQDTISKAVTKLSVETKTYAPLCIQASDIVDRKG